MADDTMTRRTYLKTIALGVAAVGFGGLAASCKHGGGGEKGSAELSCGDTSGLAPADLAMRKALAYTEHSTEPGKQCSGCMQFVPAAPGSCGSCKIVKGPINPSGYCKSWVKKA